jgi:hypothetical protein
MNRLSDDNLLSSFLLFRIPRSSDGGDKGHTYSTEFCFNSTGFSFHAAALRMPRSSAARVRRRRFTHIHVQPQS